MKTIPIYLVDAFASAPFRGNPAAVVLLEEAADPVWMQNIAMEMNQAETAFVTKQAKGYGLRWFTPTVEVDLCGHATLASAHMLWKLHLVSKEQAIDFETRSGWLNCKRQDSYIQMDFPAKPVMACDAPEGLLEALHLPQGKVFSNRVDYLVVVEDESTIRTLKPNLNALAEIKSRGIIVSAKAAVGDYDFISRFFAPASGIPEDPVTGSAHCTLGPYWGKVMDKDRLVGYQASPRGGVVKVELAGERVLLRGQAITVMRGELRGD
jgi:PhzF family phenazine biosynthesis protein